MSPEERTTPPAAVRDTAYILLLVAGYCGVASGVLTIVALQSGWAMTIAAIAHAILAVAFWIVRGGLLKRSIWAHRMALLVTGAAALAVGAICAQLIWAREPLVAVIFPASTGALLLYALIQLSRTATIGWFTLQRVKADTPTGDSPQQWARVLRSSIDGHLGEPKQELSVF